MNGILTKFILSVAVLGALALGSPAKADDPVQIEMWRIQNRLNQLTEQRISKLEGRVKDLEQKVQTLSPGYTPPAPTSPPSYTPPPAPAVFIPVPGSPLSPGEQKALTDYFDRVCNQNGDPRMSRAEQEAMEKLVKLMGK